MLSQRIPTYLSSSMMKDFIEFAKKRGFATRDELRLYLPFDVTAAEMDQVEAALLAMGIATTGSSEAPQKAGPVTQLRELVDRVRER